jgi:hypothetical protein
MSEERGDSARLLPPPPLKLTAKPPSAVAISILAAARPKWTRWLQA